jgi:hypothetical protein
MRYKTKLFTLSSLCALLLLGFILTFVFDPERSASRDALWTALDPSLKDAVARIELYGDEEIVLVKEGSLWFVRFEGKNYPAMQSRAEELLDNLVRRGQYAVRSKSDEASEKLLLNQDTAHRIIARDASENELLDLFVGSVDATRKDVYIRVNGSKDVRAGEDVFSNLFAGKRSWYDLRIFPDHEKRGITPAAIQRIITVPPPPEIIGSTDDEGAIRIELPTESFEVYRNENGWKFTDSDAAIDLTEINDLLRLIVDLSADDFLPLGANDPIFTRPGAPAGKLTIETGDGLRHTLTVGPKFDGRYSVAVSGSPYVYALANWRVGQVFEKRRRLLADKP